MKKATKYWKVILAVVLIAVSMPAFFIGYLAKQQEFKTQRSTLEAEIRSLQTTAAENARYADIQEQLPGATQELEDSRTALYAHFPTDLLEEDQIMYVLYLEEIFGTEITFSFGKVSAVESLSDGAALGGLTLTVNYETTYQGFKDMIDYLATDSRITSIQYCTLNYDDASDTASGTLTLLCYTLDDADREYVPPEVTTPDTGKPNIFD